MDGLQNVVPFLLLDAIGVFDDESDKNGKKLLRKLLPLFLLEPLAFGPAGATSEQPQGTAWSSGGSALLPVVALALALEGEGKSGPIQQIPPVPYYVPAPGPYSGPHGQATGGIVPYLPVGVPFSLQGQTPQAEGEPAQAAGQTAQPAGQSRRRQTQG